MQRIPVDDERAVRRAVVADQDQCDPVGLRQQIGAGLGKGRREVGSVEHRETARQERLARAAWRSTMLAGRWPTVPIWVYEAQR